MVGLLGVHETASIQISDFSALCTSFPHGFTTSQMKTLTKVHLSTEVGLYGLQILELAT